MVIQNLSSCFTYIYNINGIKKICSTYSLRSNDEDELLSSDKLRTFTPEVELFFDESDVLSLIRFVGADEISP